MADPSLALARGVVPTAITGLDDVLGAGLTSDRLFLVEVEYADRQVRLLTCSGQRDDGWRICRGLCTCDDELCGSWTGRGWGKPDCHRAHVAGRVDGRQIAGRTLDKELARI